MPNCQYFEPATMDDVCALLAEHGPAAKLVAGGQVVTLGIKNRWIQPTVLISLKALSELHVIEPNNGRGLKIGALATHEEISRSELVQHSAPLLAEACGRIVDRQVRATGTLGGALIAAHPASDPAIALMALDARVNVRSSQDERSIAVADFFDGSFQTVLQTNEVLTSIDLPPSPPRTTTAPEKFVLREGDFAVVNVAVAITRDDAGAVTRARIAIGNCAGTPIRATKAEDRLVGSSLTEDDIAAAARLAQENLNPPNEPMASGEYKQHLVGVLVRNALQRARG